VRQYLDSPELVDFNQVRVPTGRVMTEVQVFAAIQSIAAAQLGVTRTIKPTDELIRDLDLDSVQLITLAVEIEDHFKIELPPDASARVSTVADLCRIVVAEMWTQR
jgi:acyl carrier protein